MPNRSPNPGPGWWRRLDEHVAVLALAAMLLLPVIEMLLRATAGRGVDNAQVLVQHFGLVLAMFGAVAAERHGHLASLGPVAVADGSVSSGSRWHARRMAQGLAAVVCGLLAAASGRFVASEIAAEQVLAHGLMTWWVQATMPLGFLWLGLRLGSRVASARRAWAGAVTLPLAGLALGLAGDGQAVAPWPALALLGLGLAAGAPIFSVLGGLALALFWQDGLPLASVALSHYQITVNPSLPALPLFTLAGLVFASTGAAGRLGALVIVLFGGGVAGTVLAVALLCTFFTAFTGGSGVTILALGGVLLPLLTRVGYPERRGISLITSGSALGVLLAPSVPLIMYAVIARVPIGTMFLAGVVPAFVMIACLLVFGGYLRRGGIATVPQATGSVPLARALLAAKWELLAPLVAIGSLVSGLATPTESAALTALYAIATQALAHRELNPATLRRAMGECVQVIGGVMLILGMALGLTNYLIDAGVPDAAIEWTQSVIPNRYVFLLVLNVFLFAAGSLMEIYAAIIVLVPLLLPVARSYGIEPVHFGIIFLANMEMGFLFPPAGMNIYFAAATFRRSVREVAVAVLPAVLAIFVGTMAISWLPLLALGLPAWVGSR